MNIIGRQLDGWNKSTPRAKLVARNHKINLEEIRRWSEVENQLEKFEHIKKELEYFS